MLDYKKDCKDLYFPKTAPALIEVQEMVFAAVDGEGNPNTGEEYKAALEILYGISYGIKMSKMGATQPEGYEDFVVPPLEGLWWFKGGGLVADITDKDNFCWTSMIMLPKFVTETVFDEAKAALKKKKPDLNLEKARLFRFNEGLCAQIMHIGPYDDEPATIAVLEKFITDSGYAVDFGGKRRHHEIYLGDPRKVAPEKLKTVIRYPVKLI
jgi:hypothetical protein